VAGTDSSKTAASFGATTIGVTPAIILVGPQLGENIGMAARAMLNCGLSDLRLVKPRDGWPNADAVAASADAELVIENTRVYQTTGDAIADLELVFATTARPRDMTKRVVTPGQASQELHTFIEGGGKAGVLFGREAKGLVNDDVALADAVLSVPLNPSFSSLNLAQAVYTIGYEWIRQGDQTPPSEISSPKDTRPGTKLELGHLFEHLEAELDDSGFLRIAQKRPTMVRNLRNMFGRANLTAQEIQTLRGVITSLAGKRKTRS
jgi:tRNA/rRNA methyltransferase